MATLKQRIAAFIRPPAIRAGYNAAEVSRNRRVIHAPVRSARNDISKYPRERIMGLARELERNDGLVNRFLDLVEQYGVGAHGLRIRPASSDKAWNDKAAEELAAWSPYADLSTRQDWAGLQSLAARLWAVDGDCFMNLTRSDSGRARIQLIEAHRIDSPQRNSDGPEIFDGVELDGNYRPAAYWVKPEADPFGRSDPDKWLRLPAEAVVHIIEPGRANQYRGLSLFYPVISDLLDLQELQSLEMLAAKDNARVSKVVKTASGEVEDEYVVGGSLNRRTVETADGDKTAYYQDVLGAETVVLRSGDEFGQHASTRPSVAVQQFWDYVSARAMAGAGLPVEIILMRSLQGTMTRAALDMASGWFRSRSAMLAGHYARVVHHVLETAMESGNLPGAPADWRKVRYTPPRTINVDVGRNSAALINEFKAGFRTLENICAEHGWDWREMLEQKALEMAYATELAAKHGLQRAELIQLDPNELSSRRQEETDAEGA